MLVFILRTLYRRKMNISYISVFPSSNKKKFYNFLKIIHTYSNCLQKRMSTLKWFLHIFLKCGKWEFSCRWQFCLNLPLRLLLSTIWTNLYILRSTQKMLNGPLFGVLLHSCLKLDFIWEDQKEPDHKRAFDWTCTLWWKHVE